MLNRSLARIAGVAGIALPAQAQTTIPLGHVLAKGCVYATMPVGGLLFVTSNVAKVPLAALTRELKPFLVAHGVVLLLLTFVPALSTWAPRALGFK